MFTPQFGVKTGLGREDMGPIERFLSGQSAQFGREMGLDVFAPEPSGRPFDTPSSARINRQVRGGRLVAALESFRQDTPVWLSDLQDTIRGEPAWLDALPRQFGALPTAGVRQDPAEAGTPTGMSSEEFTRRLRDARTSRVIVDSSVTVETDLQDAIEDVQAELEGELEDIRRQIERSIGGGAAPVPLTDFAYLEIERSAGDDSNSGLRPPNAATGWCP